VLQPKSPPAVASWGKRRACEAVDVLIKIGKWSSNCAARPGFQQPAMVGEGIAQLRRELNGFHLKNLPPG
jgi:hypothetical protein